MAGPGTVEDLGLSRPGGSGAGPRSLRGNFAWTLAGNVFYAATQWGMLVVLAKKGSPEMVGQYALGLAIGAPVVLFCNLNLRAVQATDAKRAHGFSDYLRLRLLTSGVALAVISGAAAVAGYRRAALAVILAVGLAKTVESISDVFYGLMQQRERMDYVGTSLLWRGAAALGAFSAVLSATGSLLWALAGQILGWGAVLFFHDVKRGRRLLASDPPERGGAAGRRLARLAWVALPLGLTMMLVSLNTNIPRYFVERWLGPRGLGVFAALAYVVVAVGQLVQSLGQAASPRLARHVAEGEPHRFLRLVLRLVLVGFLVGGGGVAVALLWGERLLSLLYTPEYAVQGRVFAWLMAAGCVTYVGSFLGYGLTAMRVFRSQVPLFALVAAVSAAGCSWLVPRFGLLGAAWAVLVAAAVQVTASLGVLTWARARG